MNLAKQALEGWGPAGAVLEEDDACPGGMCALPGRGASTETRSLLTVRAGGVTFPGRGSWEYPSGSAWNEWYANKYATNVPLPGEPGGGPANFGAGFGPTLLASAASSSAGAAASSSGAAPSSSGGLLASILGAFKMPTVSDLGSIFDSLGKTVVGLVTLDTNAATERARINAESARASELVRAQLAAGQRPAVSSGGLGLSSLGDVGPIVALGLVALLAAKVLGR